MWLVLNVAAWTQHWDPYPFILLNLALSFQAAFTAPILMMAQNRQSEIDRHKAQLDYDVNLRAAVAALNTIGIPMKKVAIVMDNAEEFSGREHVGRAATPMYFVDCVRSQG